MVEAACCLPLRSSVTSALAAASCSSRLLTLDSSCTASLFDAHASPTHPKLTLASQSLAQCGYTFDRGLFKHSCVE